jgi:hypothetical protein
MYQFAKKWYVPVLHPKIDIMLNPIDIGKIRLRTK